VRRSRTAFRLSTYVAAALTAVALVAPPPLAAKEQFPLALTVKSEAGSAIRDAAVEISVESGEPFRVEGSTDKRGRFLAKLPDFSRVYRFKVTKETFSIFEQSVDFSTQNLVAGSTAELTIELTEDRGPTPEALYNEGVKAIQADDLATAEAKMKAALAINPELAPAWSVLAMLAADAKRWSDALEAADKTLALAPADIAALRARPEALAGLGRKEEADAALDRLAEVDRSPEGARILFNAGADAWQTKNAELAARRFEQALAANPGLYQAHTALAEVKIGGEDLAGALAELDKALALAPKEARIWRRKIEVLKVLGRGDEAAAAEASLAALGG